MTFARSLARSLVDKGFWNWGHLQKFPLKIVNCQIQSKVPRVPQSVLKRYELMDMALSKSLIFVVISITRDWEPSLLLTLFFNSWIARMRKSEL